jgi:hypothetical protein
MLILIAIIMITCFRCHCYAFILYSMALLQNNSVTSDLRGSLNGLSMSVGSLSKAAGPAIGASLYAYSVASHNRAPFDYRLTYYVVSAAIYDELRH